MQTGNIRLRALTLDDDVHYEQLLGSDWDAIKLTATIPCPCTAAAARGWLAQRLTPDNRFYAILRQPDDTFVGVIGLSKQPDGEYEVGYWVGRAHAGNGYASEALAHIIALARSWGLHKLQAGAFPENATSMHILKKAGFVFVGTIEMNLPLRGGWRTSNEYELNLA